MDIFKGIGDFFGGLFGGKKKREEEQTPQPQQQSAVSFNNNTPKFGSNNANVINNAMSVGQPKELGKSTVEFNQNKPQEIKPVQPVQPQVGREQERQQLANKYRQEETDRYNQGSDHAANFLNDIFSGGKTAQMRENTINQNIQNRVNAEMLRKYGTEDQQAKQNIATTSQNINKNASAVSNFTNNYNNNVQQTVATPVSAVKGAANSVVETVPRISGAFTELGANTIKLFDENNQFANNLIDRVRKDREKNIVRKTLNDATGLTNQDNKLAYGLGSSGTRMAIDAAMTPVTGGVVPAVVHGVEAHSDMMDNLDNIEARKKAEAEANGEVYTPSNFKARYLASTANAGVQAAIEKLGIDNVTGKIGGKFARNMAGRAITGALGEAGEEAAQQYAENLTKKLFDNKQDIHEGVAESALMGGIMGGAGKMAFGGMNDVKNPYKSNTSYDPKALYEAERNVVRTELFNKNNANSDLSLADKEFNIGAPERLAKALRNGADGDISFMRMPNKLLGEVNAIRKNIGQNLLKTNEITAYKNAVNNHLNKRVLEGMSPETVAHIAADSFINPYSKALPVDNNGAYDRSHIQMAVSGNPDGKYNTATFSQFGDKISLKNITPRKSAEIKNLLQRREEILSGSSDGGAGVVPSSTDVGGAPFSAGRAIYADSIAQNSSNVNNIKYKLAEQNKDLLATHTLTADNLDDETRAILKNRGVETIEYKAGDNADRMAKLNALDDLKFKKTQAENLVRVAKENLQARHQELTGDQSIAFNEWANELERRAQGFFNEKTGKITINDGDLNTLNHELGHKLLTRADNRAELLADIRNTVGDEALNAKYGENYAQQVANMNPEERANLFAEEYLADGFSDYYNGILAGEDSQRLGAKLGIPPKVLAYYDRIVEAIKGILGLQQDTLKQFYAQAETGKFAQNYKQNTPVYNESPAYKITQDLKGDLVEIDQNIFEGVAKKDRSKTLKKYLQDNLQGNEYRLNYGEDGEAKITNVSVNKMSNPLQNNSLLNKKGQIVSELPDILTISQKTGWAPDGKSHSFARDGFEYRQSRVKLGDEIYTVNLNVGLNKSGKLLYEINDIKKEPWNREDTRLNHSSYTDSLARNADEVKYKAKNSDFERQLNYIQARNNNEKITAISKLAKQSLEDGEKYPFRELAKLAGAEYDPERAIRDLSDFYLGGDIETATNVYNWAKLAHDKQDALRELNDKRNGLLAQFQEDYEVSDEYDYKRDERVEKTADPALQKEYEGWINRLENEYSEKYWQITDDFDVKIGEIEVKLPKGLLEGEAGWNFNQELLGNTQNSQAVQVEDQTPEAERIKVKVKTNEEVDVTDHDSQNGANKQIEEIPENIQTAENTDQKTRKFAKTVLDTDTPPKDFVKLMHTGDESLKYTPKKNSELWNKATKSVQESPERVFSELENTRVASDETMAKGIALAKHYQAMGDDLKASELYVELAKKATEAGRTVQALNLMRRTTPEGVLMSTMREVERYNDKMKNKPNKQINITPEQRAEFLGKLREAYAMPENNLKEIRARRIAIGEAIREVRDQIPSSKWDKFTTLWKAGLLTAPTTHIRNIAGNVINGGSEKVAQTVGSGFDWVIGKGTGRRTLTLKALPALKLGFKFKIKAVCEFGKSGLW